MKTSDEAHTEVERAGGELPPRWRRATPGWIGLHILIGLTVISFLQGVAFGSGAAFLSDGVIERIPLAVWLLATLTSVIGWLLFVYLRRPPRVRWLSLGTLLVTGVIVLAAAAATADPVLRADDFSGSDRQFSQDSDRFVDLSYSEREYRVLIKDANHPQIMRTILSRAYPAVRVESSLRFPEGTSGETGAGIGCWGGFAAYQLVVTPAGEAFLLEVVSEQTGERRPLTDMIEMPAQPLRGPVRLRLDCVGGGIGPTAVVGWVSGERIGAVGVTPGVDGFEAPGFVVYASENSTEVRFDDFSVRTDTGSPETLDRPIGPVEGGSR